MDWRERGRDIDVSSGTDNHSTIQI